MRYSEILLDGAVPFKGYLFKKLSSGNDRYPVDSYSVLTKKGEPVAGLVFDQMSRAREDAVCIHVNIQAKWRRQGIGRIIYDFAEALAANVGKKLVPSPRITAAAEAFWKKRDPERLRKIDYELVRRED